MLGICISASFQILGKKQTVFECITHVMDTSSCLKISTVGLEYKPFLLEASYLIFVDEYQRTIFIGFIRLLVRMEQGLLM